MLIISSYVFEIDHKRLSREMQAEAERSHLAKLARQRKTKQEMIHSSALVPSNLHPTAPAREIAIRARRPAHGEA
jgi:hypothetical protein